MKHLSKLRLLMIEEAADRRSERHLRRVGLDFECAAVESWPALEQALGNEWDVILADYHLPALDFEQVLAHVRFVLPLVPVILLSGGMDMDRVADLLKMGVSDFVYKDRLTRLMPAIERALREGETERDRRVARRQAERFASFPKLNPSPVLETNLAGEISFCNEATLKQVAAQGLPGPAAFLPTDLPDLLFLLSKSRDPVAHREVVVGRRIFAVAIHFVAEFGMARLYAQDVSALKETEQALRDSEARLRLALEAARAGAWEWDVRTDRSLCSAAALVLVGLAPDTPAFAMDRWREIIHADDLALVQETIVAALRCGAPFEVEFRRKASARGASWLMSRGRPVVDGEGRVVRYVGIVIDMTETVELRRLRERYQAHLKEQVARRTEELFESKARLRRQNAALEHAQHIGSIGSWEWEQATDHLEWSAELYRIAGWNPALPAPRREAQAALHVPGDWQRQRAAVKQLLQDGIPFELDLAIERHDGERRWIAVRTEVRRNAAGDVDGLCGTVLDITGRKRMEATVAEQGARLEDLSRRLLDVQEEERGRLANLVHDTLSPNLATVRIGLQLLTTRMPPPLEETLRGQVDDLQAVLRETLEDARNLSAELRPVVLDFAGLLPALEDYARQYSRRTGVVTRVRGEEGPQRLAPAQESVLFRIAQEALQNCARHARAQVVDIEFAQGERGVRLSIRDDGVGFDLRGLCRTGDMGGLGLVTMRERAEFAGGRFSLTSAPGGGTQIEVEL